MRKRGAVISFPAGGRVILFVKTSKLALEGFPILFNNKCWEVFPQWLLREVDECPPLLTELRVYTATTSPPLYVSVVWCFVNQKDAVALIFTQILCILIVFVYISKVCYKTSFQDLRLRGASVAFTPHFACPPCYYY
jgi:hypothetical protein